MTTTTPPAPADTVRFDRPRPPNPQRARRIAPRVRGDRGLVEGIEALIGGLFLILLFLFISQVVVWWHARNILEQAAAEGARIAAAADTDCTHAPDAATAMALQLADNWVRSLSVDCTGDDTTEGALITVTVSASTPAFLFPGSLGVTATASAPEES
ncbi:MAG: TadE/TadG family type IV pilus assembly protein [Actinomycetota bacterium]